MTAPQDNIARRVGELASQTGVRASLYLAALDGPIDHYEAVAASLTDIYHVDYLPHEIPEMQGFEQFKQAANLSKLSNSSYLDAAMLILITCAIREQYDG